MTAVECRMVAILPRASVDRDRLVRTVLAVAAGGGVMPPQLIVRLLEHFRRMQRAGLI
jgi:hypothetical protein